MNLDKYEQTIIKELIRNPRISDNQISKKTKIPLKTVNRKRKLLESNNEIYYFAMPSYTKLNIFGASKMYIVTMKHGISRKEFFEKLFLSHNQQLKDQIKFQSKHITFSSLGEVDGHLCFVLMIQSRLDSDIIEIFNVDIMNILKKNFGDDCIDEVKVVTLDNPIRILNNYLIHPQYTNMSKGVIKKNWDDEFIFVS